MDPCVPEEEASRQSTHYNRTSGECNENWQAPSLSKSLLNPLLRFSRGVFCVLLRVRRFAMAGTRSILNVGVASLH